MILCMQKVPEWATHPCFLPCRHSPRYTSPDLDVYMPKPLANPEWNSPSYLHMRHQYGPCLRQTSCGWLIWTLAANLACM